MSRRSVASPDKALLSRSERESKNRSALRERAAVDYLAEQRRVRDWRDMEIIERSADRLNCEALDTLEYQRLP